MLSASTMTKMSRLVTSLQPPMIRLTQSFVGNDEGVNEGGEVSGVEEGFIDGLIVGDVAVGVIVGNSELGF